MIRTEAIKAGGLETAGRSSSFNTAWRLHCILFGHHVNNRAFGENREAHRRCRCGEEFLREDRAVTRIAHVLSCFFLGHTYLKACERDCHHEYVCSRCGHPLLFKSEESPYARKGGFKKRVRYLCNLSGHSVHTVTERHGLVEYACFCGHSFLKAERHRARVTHTLVCFVAGHFVHFVERRNGYGEYLCRYCGHTFCFVVKDDVA